MLQVEVSMLAIVYAPHIPIHRAVYSEPDITTCITSVRSLDYSSSREVVKVVFGRLQSASWVCSA